MSCGTSQILADAHVVSVMSAAVRADDDVSVSAPMSTDQIVAALHDSDVFGTFVETGVATPVAHALLLVSGASRTVFLSECPYAAEFVEEKYGDIIARAVSIDFVKRIADYHASAKKPARHNLVYAASFQVGSGGVCTHGWIAIEYRRRRLYFHLSVREPQYSRRELSDLIGAVGLELIWFMRYNTLIQHSALATHFVDVDAILNDKVEYEYRTALDFLFIKDAAVDSVLVFAPPANAAANQLAAPKLIRLEDVYRGHANLIVYKGSFNPPTLKHLQIARDVYLLSHFHADNANSALVFNISVKTVDKRVDMHNLLRRIQLLTTLDMVVVVNICGRFAESIEYFHGRLALADSLRLIFPVGADTVARFEPGLLQRNPSAIEFVQFERTDVSSTKVRQLLDEIQRKQDEHSEMSNKAVSEMIADLSSLVPSKIVSLLLETR